MVSSKQFVEVWLQALEEGHNQTWIANQLGMSRQNVTTRAKTLRRSGVNLPKPSQAYRYTPEHVAVLNEIIEKSIDNIKH